MICGGTLDFIESIFGEKAQITIDRFADFALVNNFIAEEKSYLQRLLEGSVASLRD